MHFILSIIFLVPIFLLTFCYGCVFTVAGRYLLKVTKSLVRYWEIDRYSFLPGRHIWFLKRSLVKRIAVISLVLICSLYVVERIRWAPHQTSYKSARHYFITGIVLQDLRSFMAFVSYPERKIWKPAVWLQQAISKSGRKLIPEDDGEHGIWVYHFVLAPFINKIHAPHTEEVYPLIDAADFVLKALATNKIADKDLREKNRYIIYPLVALYYQYSYKGRYSPIPGGNRFDKGLYKDPVQYLHLQQVVDWSLKLEGEWQSNLLVEEYMQDNPDIEILQLASTALLLHDIIYYQIHNLQLTCEDRYLNLYFEYVTRYRAEDSPYYKVDRKVQKRLDPPVLYHGGRINFFGHRLCGLPKLPAYNIRSAKELGGEGPGWYDSFVELNKKLVPMENQQDNLTRVDPWK